MSNHDRDPLGYYDDNDTDHVESYRPLYREAIALGLFIALLVGGVYLIIKAVF